MNKLLFIIGLLFSAAGSFGQTKVVSRNINLRTSPEINQNKICVIPNRATVTVVADTVYYENWTKVDYNGRIGFVYTEFLKDYAVGSERSTHRNSPNRSVKYYRNSDGDKVQSPTYYQFVPAGATAECMDGTYSFSRNRRGTCSHHGGVKKWL